jgi:uncharacterized Rossmann fold enzyme
MVREAVKVAFYLDTAAHVAIAEHAIASVRKAMPDAEIWHLTTIDGPVLSADCELRLDVQGEFAYRQAAISAELSGDVLFLDVDVTVNEDVSHVFAHDFDVCVTTDMRPGAPGIKYNGGVIFSRCPDYWRAIAEAGRGMDFYKTAGDWEPIERARGAVADSGKFKLMVLPGEEYNYIPATAGDVRGKLTHYRGKRKAWMIPVNEFATCLNTAMETMIVQAEQNLSRGLPMFIEQPENYGEALIVGGGPSLKGELPNLRMKRDRGGIVFALNGAHDWLIDHGIIPDFHVLLDAREENVRFVQNPRKEVVYLVAAQCHPVIFDALKGYNVTTWAACLETPEQETALATKFAGIPLMLVGGGATVGLKTMNLAYLWGFRRLRVYGLDSSYSDGENHAYRQELNDKESRMEIHAAGRDFICAPWMAKQAMEFQQQYRQFSALGVKVRVHGDGLIPHIVRQLEKEALHV